MTARAVPHRVFGGAGGDVPADLPRLADPDDIIAKRGEVRSLVLVAFAADEISVRVWRKGFFSSPRATASCSVVKCGQATKPLGQRASGRTHFLW